MGHVGNVCYIYKCWTKAVTRQGDSLFVGKTASRRDDLTYHKFWPIRAQSRCFPPRPPASAALDVFPIRQSHEGAPEVIAQKQNYSRTNDAAYPPTANILCFCSCPCLSVVPWYLYQLLFFLAPLSLQPFFVFRSSIYTAGKWCRT